ncbi:MAG: RagB/SusD family nutrient uptake outer membrane protein [Dysgonamonadaceae bacterium]|nr:RagB/SusD family nutrient uptake outer membrane protein [Dysgonamonadaceae bacterium]
MKHLCISHTQEHENEYSFTRQLVYLLTHFRMKRIYFLIISIALLFSSCNDYLDTVPGDKFDDAAVWNNPSLVEEFVFDIYNALPYPYQWYMNASLVDEAVPAQQDGVVSKVLTSTMSPDDSGVFQNNWATCMEGWWWNEVYSSIRACNLFFERIEQTPYPDDETKNQIKGEVHFLRGYFYYLLLAQYGGVPLIDHTYQIGDDYSKERNTLEETVNFIVTDLNQAASQLPVQSDKTRATQGAALAIKSRVLLYAASDLFNSQASWSNGYSYPELVSYVGGDRAERWRTARDAAKVVIDLGIYDLYEENPDPVKNFEDLFLSMSSDEQIFITIYDKINFPYWATDWISSICGTPSWGGYGLNQVTGNLADAYENSDGTCFDWNTQSSNPYANRDPRFYATILHEGADWVRDGGYTPDHIVQVGAWEDSQGTVVKSGADYQENATGYYIRKFIDPNFPTYYYGPRQPQPYIQIRYAEILLNYAEACIALGEDGEARRVMNLIRKRAGMPDVTESGTALLDRCRNERRVELAWEQHRFFDVRRWMIAPSAYVPATGVKVTYPTDDSVENPTYRQTTILGENRAWNNSHYLIPISRAEMQKNPKLIQNPGYN